MRRRCIPHLKIAVPLQRRIEQRNRFLLWTRYIPWKYGPSIRYTITPERLAHANNRSDHDPRGWRSVTRSPTGFSEVGRILVLVACSRAREKAVRWI
jgi:hypothetical protein